MNMSSLFVRDTLVFADSMEMVERTFSTEEHIPSQVFRRGFNWFAFEEFDWSMSDGFWSFIQDLARSTGDASLLMAVLDPEPEHYFKKEFGYYNWADIPVSASSDDYWELLNSHPEDSPADSFLVNSERVIWLPRSAKWAVWGERSYGVCVLATRERMQIGSWRDIDWALKYYFPNAFKDRIVPPEFIASLRLNYSPYCG